jgi:hypothetical protein
MPVAHPEGRGAIERFPYRFSGLPLNASKLSTFLIFKDPLQSINAYTKGAKLRFTITPEGEAPWLQLKWPATPASCEARHVKCSRVKTSDGCSAWQFQNPTWSTNYNSMR